VLVCSKLDAGEGRLAPQPLDVAGLPGAGIVKASERVGRGPG